MGKNPNREAMPNVAWNRFLAGVLGRALARHHTLLSRSRSGLDPKLTHILRTETRRLLSEITLAGVACAYDVTKLTKSVKRSLRLTAEIRDADVQLKKVQVLSTISPTLKRFSLYLHRRRKSAARRAIKKMKKRRMEKRLSRLIKKLNRKSSEQDSRSAVIHSLFEAYAKAVKSSSRSRRCVRELHRARLDLKKLRYAMECLAPLLPSGGARWCDALHRHQRMLGEIHDVDVLLTALETYAARHQRQKHGLLAAAKLVARDRSQLVRCYRRCPFPELPRSLRASLRRQGHLDVGSDRRQILV